MTATVDRKLQISIFTTIGGIFAAISLIWMAGHEGVQLALSMKTFKTFAAIITAGGLPAAIFNWLFEKYGWRYPVFQGWFVKVPDLSGVWVGTSTSDYFKDNDGKAQAIFMTATIDHRFDDILYTQEGQARSVVLAADLTTDSRDIWKLIVTYDNYPQIDPEKLRDNPDLAKNSRPHHGTHILTLYRPLDTKRASSSWALDGHYWTNKERRVGSGDRGTTGTLHLKWERRVKRPKLFG